MPLIGLAAAYDSPHGERPEVKIPRAQRILVVSHEASRTGAPRMVVEILNALPAEEWDRRVLVRWPGPLLVDMASTGSRVRSEPLRRVRALRQWRLARRPVAWFEQVLAAAIIMLQRPDLVWCNTSDTACYLRPAILLHVPVVLYAHEPGPRIAHLLERYGLHRCGPELVLAGCAPQTCSDLAAACGTARHHVVCLCAVPDEARILALAEHEPPALPRGGVLVGGCGTPDSRKGVDLWLEMVERICDTAADLDPHFVWIGGDAPAHFAEWAAVRRLGDRVTFVGSVDNPYPYLRALDVFTLTSRVDQFPLVMLEAMHLGRPVVAFAVSDDIVEAIGDCGRVVPPENVKLASEVVVELLRDPEERTHMGERAALRARERFGIEDFRAGVRRLAAAALVSR
jgi:glycosyltransferase involved in cell wall biosynthesis